MPSSPTSTTSTASPPTKSRTTPWEPACLLLNHHPFSELRQHWADNPTDNETTWTLYGTIIAASTMDPHLDADALARFYQLPRTTIDEATAL